MTSRIVLSVLPVVLIAGWLNLTSSDSVCLPTNSMEGMTALGKPDMSIFRYTSTTMDIYDVATGMEDRGWLVSKDNIPFKAIHFMQSPGHEPYVDAYLSDLEDAVELVASATITDRGPEANYT